MRGPLRRPTSVLLAGLGCLVALTGLTPPEPAHAVEAAVIWPEVTKLNPDVTDYTIEIQGDPSDTFRLNSYGATTDFGVAGVLIPGPGTYTVPFVGSAVGGDFALKLRRCDSAGQNCVEVGWSPNLEVWRGLSVTGFPARLGPLKPMRVNSSGPAEASTVDVTLQLLSGDTVVVQDEVPDLPAVSWLSPLGDQASLVDGAEYELRAEVSADTADFGRLTWTQSHPVVWDASHQPAIMTTVREGWLPDPVPSTVVYPLVDGFGDTMVFTNAADDTREWRVRIHDSGGGQVFDRSERPSDPTSDIEWAPVDSSGDPLAEGSYTATITSTDQTLNESTTTLDLTVSHQAPQRVVWRRTVTPADSLVQGPLFGCGALRRPGRKDWPTSFGYRTKRVCPESVPSFAETFHEVAVPASLADLYGRVQLTIVGGASRQAPRSHLRYVISPSFAGGVITGHKIGPAVGRHVTPWQGGVDFRGDERILRWGVAAVYGAKYDVKKFAVKVEYYVLGTS